MVRNADVQSMTSGSLWGKILKFAGYFMMTAFLQQLYSAADIIVVSRYAGQEALAGVGTCSVVVNLFLNFILGFSAGATVVLGHAIGADDRKEIGKVTHTALAIAVFFGLTVSVICLVFTKELLLWVDVPENVMGEASAYLRIVSVGYIPTLVYNFGAAILRAKGDTKQSLYIVSVSGVINIVLNLFFVCVLKMRAAGVALATVIANVYNGIMILRVLRKQSDETRISLRKIRIHKQPFLRIIRYGLPSGIQSAVYSLSNTLVQSGINSFGSAASAGSAATTSITDFYNSMENSMYQAAVVSTSQNFGARKFDRIKSTIWICTVYCFGLWVIQSCITFFCDEFLIGIYASKDPAVFEMAIRKFRIVGYSYGLLGLVNIMSGALRGIGASFINMLMSIIGVCGLRVLWLVTVFPRIGTYEFLFYSYPLSWFGTAVIHSIMFFILFRRIQRMETKEGLLQ